MPSNSTSLSGLGNSAGLGAATGALGMGAAHLLQPKDKEDQDLHHRSLLKSMLLGGALGGVVGGGGRAIYDAMSPQMANDPGSGVEHILNAYKSNVSSPVESSQFDQAVGGHPAVAGAGMGVGVSALSRLRQKLQLGRIANLANKPIKDVQEPPMPATKWMATRPAIHGLGAAALTSLYGYGIRPNLEREQLVNQALEGYTPTAAQ